MIEYQLTFKHWLCLAFIATTILITSIHPLEFESYLLHQAGTIFMLIVLFIMMKKIGLSFLTFSLYLGFLFIHIVGAHYLYSYVPYNEWFQQVFHFDLNQTMGWTRNMYDRWVHLVYGLLLYPFFYRVFQVWLPSLKPYVLFLLVIQFVMATSLIYEWVEWLIAIQLSPEDAENYNGQQGDIWDAHMDMLLATIGSLIYGILYLIYPALNANSTSKK
ncbi:DUF2238 domain-containing protein [Acinetobacter sp. PK01]|jgi:putative membrane protein|uniref:DUF2238 domain-containing protein n=1 Tax=Acinetobacter sp. PK01 TaxID=2930198 RepID=UPI001FB648D6|nr:DUF2238 domain-containing protein [Acinetobacter sp. PK01]UOG18592.1 DUF2238 domain-containing protein [Acinetobacter sp. PK01]